jgi:hypothetical protein
VFAMSMRNTGEPNLPTMSRRLGAFAALAAALAWFSAALAFGLYWPTRESAGRTILLLVGLGAISTFSLLADWRGFQWGAALLTLLPLPTAIYLLGTSAFLRTVGSMALLSALIHLGLAALGSLERRALHRKGHGAPS